MRCRGQVPAACVWTGKSVVHIALRVARFCQHCALRPSDAPHPVMLAVSFAVLLPWLQPSYASDYCRAWYDPCCMYCALSLKPMQKQTDTLGASPLGEQSAWWQHG